ncbi:kappa-type opioid receptor-like [Mytilus californianus]|uniref:kappa-type opioid receptor-like n=1 Tax=Mytilus californianus TaxID=6549 RepID=UPI0022465425|nr:kappa-type opioid receptor-like [Mytilus californianus]
MTLVTMTNSTLDQSSGFPVILIVFIVLQQLVFITALLGNSLVIFIFISKLKLKTNTNKFVVNLAIADMLTGIVAGIQVFYFMYPSIANNMTVCFLRYLLISYTTLVSQLTVLFTALDRYIAICHPHHYAKILTTNATIILSLFPWIFCLFFVALPFWGLHVWSPGFPCEYLFLFHRGFYLASSLIVYSFSMITFVMYILILKAAWRFYSRVAPVSGGSVNNQQTAKSKNMDRDVRSAKVTGIVTLAFSFCWLPFTSFPFRKGIGIDQTTITELTVMNWLVFLGLLNSIINPFIYAWKRRDFIKECKKTFRCLKNNNQEETVVHVTSQP